MGGGGGSIAARAVAKAEPDGYTFLFAGPGHAAVPAMHKQPPYDPINDFAPVSLVTQFPLVVVIKPSLPAKSFPSSLRFSKPIRACTRSGRAAWAGHLIFRSSCSNIWLAWT